MGRWWVKNPWVYSLGMVFLVTNVIYWTRLLQASDKAVIQGMIDIDQTIAKLNLTAAEAPRVLNERFAFDWSVMDHISKWCLYDGYLLMFCVQKFLFTALTLSCPVPGGIFTPTFCLGAVVGQLYASLLIKALGFFQLTGIV